MDVSFILCILYAASVEIKSYKHLIGLWLGRSTFHSTQRLYTLSTRLGFYLLTRVLVMYKKLTNSNNINNP